MEKKKMKDNKEVYEKPLLRTIELATEEIMAVGCKTDVSSGSQGACTQPVLCVQSGS